MKAVFINVNDETVSEIDFEGDFREIQKQLGVELFTTVGLENGDTLFVDDEGMINGTQLFFELGHGMQPFAGNGLILGTTRDGDSTNCKTVASDLSVSFTSLRELKRRFACR